MIEYQPCSDGDIIVSSDSEMFRTLSYGGLGGQVGQWTDRVMLSYGGLGGQVGQWTDRVMLSYGGLGGQVGQWTDRVMQVVRECL